MEILELIKTLNMPDARIEDVKGKAIMPQSIATKLIRTIDDLVFAGLLDFDANATLKQISSIVSNLKFMDDGFINKSIDSKTK